MLTTRTVRQVEKALFASALGMAIALVSGAAMPRASYANNPLQLAQTTPLAAQTISVTGQGRASAPASSAAVIFTFVSNSYPEYSEETGKILSPVDIFQPADIQSVVDAVEAEGLAYDIQVSQEFYDYQSLQMVVKLRNPTSDRINKIKETAIQETFKKDQLLPSPAGVIYATDSCEQIEAEARQKAIADAREQAAKLAADSGLALGELSAISGGLNFNYYGLYQIGCVSNLDEILNYGSQYGFADYYNSRNSEVTVSFSLYATYNVGD